MIADQNLTDLKIALDTAWVLIMGLLVFFMNTGFAMLETGFCRAKNAVSMLAKNVAVFFVSTIAFWFIGFSFMFSEGFKVGIINLPESLFFSEELSQHFSARDINLPLEAIFFFQVVFAGTAATIVSGAVAERVKFSAFLIFTFIVCCCIYPVVGQWILGKGFLYQLGVRDFAGSIMVHTLGGFAALAGVIAIGPRVGKYNKNLTPNPILGHSIPMITLGGFILWLGWFGFNMGCVFGFSPALCSHILICTNACAVAGGLGAMVISKLLLRKPDLSMIVNGLLGGLVSSTACCAYVSLVSASIIGLVAGCLVVLSVLTMDRFFHIDDPVGAISVHGISGIWGAVSVGLFAMPSHVQYAGLSYPKPGIFFGGTADQLFYQLIGVFVVVLWSFLISLAVWMILKKLIGIRVSQKEEVDGLDIGEHGMEAYPGFVGSGDSLI